MIADNLCNKLTSDKNVLSLPLTVDGGNVLDGVLEIVKNVKPLWNIEHVQLKVGALWTFCFPFFSCEIEWTGFYFHFQITFCGC